MSDVDQDVKINIETIYSNSTNDNKTFNPAYNPTDDSPWNGNDIDSKEDPNDKIGRVDSHFANTHSTDDAPTFTRMSSQLSRRISLDQASLLDQSGVGQMLPEGLTNYIPGLGRPKVPQLKELISVIYVSRNIQLMKDLL